MSKTFISIVGNKFTLGDAEVKLKGFNYSDPDSPWVWCLKWNREALSTGLAAAQNLGANCIRIWIPISHEEAASYGMDAYAVISEVLDTAERYGIRCYIGLRWQHKWTQAGSLEDKANLDYLNPLLNMLKNDPRVIAYDLMNEADHMSNEYWQWNMNPAGAQIRLEWLRRMRDVIKKTDTNHPVSMGATFSYSHWLPDVPFSLESFVDFVDFHYYRRNYREATLAEAIRSVKEHSDKPIIIGEFGFSSCPDYTTLGEPKHSEELQAKMFNEYLTDCEAEDISGAIAWALTDYREHFDDGESSYGLLSADYSPKPAAAVFKNRFPVGNSK